jgi:hypothetical protein
MATVTGTSGAWKDVYGRLRNEGLPVSHPREIRPALDEIKNTYDQKVAQLFVDVANEIAAFEDQLVVMEQDIAARIQSRRKAAYGVVAEIEPRLARLRQETGFFRRLLNRIRIKTAEYQKRRVQANLERDVANLEKIVTGMRQRLQDMKNSKTEMVDERKSALDLKISRLDGILESKELAGAQAEIEVVEMLARLPSSYHVFNDVRLKADNFMRYEGVPLQSAQIDHVVLAPFGVFVIEVKNWSQQFVQDGDHFDPYTQVGRAGFLCKVLLKDRGYQTKVRTIIACRGQLPPKREDQYVKVLQLHKLNGYITWFKDASLDSRHYESVREFLSSHV